MKTKSLQHLSRTMTILVAGLLLAGCASSSGYKQAEKAGAGIAEFRVEINNGKQAIDATMQSLGQISSTANTDPRAAFQQFRKDLTKLESVTAKVRQQNQKLKAKGETYFKQWQQELATMQNSEIRRVSEEQKAKMEATFANIQTHTEPLKTRFDPWLSDLRDLRTYLNNDLTVTGIHAAQGLIAKAQGEGTEIQRSMDLLVSELNNVSNAMTPATTPAPAAATTTTSTK